MTSDELAAIEGRTWFAGCVPTLTAEVRRLRAELIEAHDDLTKETSVMDYCQCFDCTTWRPIIEKETSTHGS